MDTRRRLADDRVGRARAQIPGIRHHRRHVAGLVRVGFLANFTSEPTLTGFIRRVRNRRLRPGLMHAAPPMSPVLSGSGHFPIGIS